MNLKPISKLHHAAYRCRDAEQTRWFYEDVLGLKLAAALEFDQMSGTDIDRNYLHLFFDLGDGSFIAFFDQPSAALPEKFEPEDGMEKHIALRINDENELEGWKNRIKAANVKCVGPVDHGFAKSLYFYDPNGIQCEIACNTDAYSDIMSAKGASAQDTLKEWTSKSRPHKEKIFGAAALDSRMVDTLMPTV
jgi:catechol 2,3-dioxygenase-like lactoylglutathione lyase family enzyme